jgi:formamidopyrimidine-DNA glycosylase
MAHRTRRFDVQGGRYTSDYLGYLASPKWAAKRTEVFKRDGYACRLCSSQDGISVHHKTYRHLGNEPLEELITLCNACHDEIHSSRTPTETVAAATVRVVASKVGMNVTRLPDDWRLRRKAAKNRALWQARRSRPR